MSSKVVQPTWYKPDSSKINGDKPVLKLYNSLTRSKDEFIPVDQKRNQITWYSCGPTVYDSSHMGHARNYVTIDINRRILSNFFNYDIKFVQNVTDIDDKIITRARQNFLFQSHVIEKFNTIDDTLIKLSLDSIQSYIVKNINKLVNKDLSLESPENNFSNFLTWLDSINVAEFTLKSEKFPMYIKQIKLAIYSIKEFKNLPISEFSENLKDIVSPILDSKYGSTVSDPDLFRQLPAYWENQFDQDMTKLNVLPPTVKTRVSEYVPQIVDFVSKIIDKGYGYATSDGSVYFDTARFDSSPNHDYAKLQPWNKGKLDLIEDGEGSLSVSNTTGKKSPNDFALWKASKPGEPFWSSPWGQGRPGWHIECSVMASDILGSNIDIHSGGIDLAFPHHDNELAQSEACFDCKQWINYFLHTGHLHIEGQKMSKSLKNFITIDEALKSHSSKQLRLAFAMCQWNNQLDFKTSLLAEVESVEKNLDKFFTNIRSHNNEYLAKVSKGEIVSETLRDDDKILFGELEKTKLKIYEQFCDNLSTPLVIRSIVELVTITNNYLSIYKHDFRIRILLEITRYITKILDIIGFETRKDQLGWEDISLSLSTLNNSASSQEEYVLPFIQLINDIRDEIRTIGIESKHSRLLDLSDRIRDKDLLNLGIGLDDRNGQKALIKFLSSNEKRDLIKLRDEKEKVQQEKLNKKLAQLKLKEEQEKIKRNKEKVNPIDEWDNDGIPTKTQEGVEITKSARKKLIKQWQQQKKLYENYLKLQ
ncbi:cysteine--tRNA ligase [Ascoidea rubescens DSM 1968]|uniref:cysteine--tRNA ligase n=1 Tax=Ascoidea rubescens DSM 1968 TaxID=1344418 RepID=A0A1D2VJE2_9ASCO|nr:cysteinyl-tRNA synthetase [Ascoidea rubescens DSM 1968]ODV61731.1 cysteinyl-tRNA synthetase [Ascoidea rubescens DSM 1968]